MQKCEHVQEEMKKKLKGYNISLYSQKIYMTIYLAEYAYIVIVDTLKESVE